VQHLHGQHPDQGWGQYVQNDELVWNLIAFAGHSQGGGHVGLIARDHVIHRAIMLNSPSDAGGGMPAPWISDAHMTPNESYYAFIHSGDNGDRRLQVYGLFGFDTLGAPVNVDENEPPYDNTHILFTELETTNAHGVVIGDDLVPNDANGQPVYAPAWRYLVGQGE